LQQAEEIGGLKLENKQLKAENEQLRNKNGQLQKQINEIAQKNIVLENVPIAVRA
jgi:cell division protein FtsB